MGGAQPVELGTALRVRFGGRNCVSASSFKLNLNSLDGLICLIVDGDGDGQTRLLRGSGQGGCVA